MQAQPKDELYYRAVARLARDWDETDPADRAQLLADFPELNGYGLKVDDPFDPEVVEREREVIDQCRLLDRTAPNEDAAQFADEPNLRDQLNSGAPAAPPPPDVAAGLRKDARAAVDWSAKRQAPKEVRMANRFRDVARRRRVLAGLKSEKELATGIGAHHGPDSEPWDVLHIADPLGNVITDPQHIKQALFVRAQAVERLKQPDVDEGQRAFLQKILDTPAHAIEAKTLLKTARNYAQMNPKALAAKKAWAEKHGVSFHTVVFDKRKGKKHSGHTVYVAPNTLAPTTNLASMQKVGNLGDVLNAVSAPKG